MLFWKWHASWASLTQRLSTDPYSRVQPASIRAVASPASCLHPVERLALQGCPVELANCFSKMDLMRVTGNSFSVPVVTAVFRNWSVAVATPAALGLMEPPRARRSSADLLLRRTMLDTRRELLGVLERLAEVNKRRRTSSASGGPGLIASEDVCSSACHPRVGHGAQVRADVRGRSFEGRLWR